MLNNDNGNIEKYEYLLESLLKYSGFMQVCHCVHGSTNIKICFLNKTYPY